MPRCIIIAPLYKGEAHDLLAPQPGDLLLCADGGYPAARRWGFTPDLTIGDFDSMPDAPVDGPVLRLPTHKDDTDMVACIKEGRRRGYREFVAAGCLGGRMDHTLACMQCAADCALRGESLYLCDGDNRLTILAPGTYRFPAVPGRKLSLLAWSEEVRGVTLTGTLWPLDGATLSHRYPLGCSNEWTAPEAALTFAQGLLVVAFCRDA